MLPALVLVLVLSIKVIKLNQVSMTAVKVCFNFSEFNVIFNFKHSFGPLTLKVSCNFTRSVTVIRQNINFKKKCIQS